MRALIFAAGKGTRLKPFTDTNPKALVRVGGVPMLEIVIRRLIEAGVDETVVNVHHFADKIVDFLEANNNFGITIHVSDESDRLLETGGGLLKARQWLDRGDGSSFFVHNADILTDVSLTAMMKYHNSTGAVTTLLCTPRETSRHLYFDRVTKRLEGWGNDRNGAVVPTDFVPASSMDKLAFDGVHILSPKIFEPLQAYSERIGDSAFSITSFYAESARNLDIRAYTPVAGTFIWHDIGSPEKLEAAETAMTQLNKARSLDLRYLRMARIWAENSYCRRRQVGALIVKDKMIISDGFNGTPSGFENVCEDEATGLTKPYVLHAEANAITKVACSNNSSEGATLYVTASPCLECAKLIIQAGIRRVVFDELYRITDGINLLRRAGIECRHLPLGT